MLTQVIGRFEDDFLCHSSGLGATMDGIMRELFTYTGDFDGRQYGFKLKNNGVSSPVIADQPKNLSKRCNCQSRDTSAHGRLLNGSVNIFATRVMGGIAHTSNAVLTIYTADTATTGTTVLPATTGDIPGPD